MVAANFGPSFSLHVLSIFVHISGSIWPITLIWASLERSSPPAEVEHRYGGLLRTKYRICIYPCYVAYTNTMRNKSISKHVRYKLKVSDKTKRCPTQVKDVR